MTTEIEKNALLAKIIINGIMICETGLHIGTGGYSSEIGGIDSPVVKNPVTGIPYVPGSSYKGKMRSLIERTRPGIKLQKIPGKNTRIHWCDSREEALKCDVCRLFGYLPMGDDKSENNQIHSPLIVRDMDMINHKYVADHIVSPLKYTEWKSENALDRVTAAANPRQIERVPAFSSFWMEMVYDVTDFNSSYVRNDLKTLGEAMALIEDSALGGHGSRGYGKVSFKITNIATRNISYYRDMKPESPLQKVIYPSSQPDKKDRGKTDTKDTAKGMTLHEYMENLDTYCNDMDAVIKQ